MRLIKWVVAFFSLSLATNSLATCESSQIDSYKYTASGVSHSLPVLIVGRVLWSYHKTRKYRAGRDTRIYGRVIEIVAQTAAVHCPALVTFLDDSNAQFVFRYTIPHIIVRSSQYSCRPHHSTNLSSNLPSGYDLQPHNAPYNIQRRTRGHSGHTWGKYHACESGVHGHTSQ